MRLNCGKKWKVSGSIINGMNKLNTIIAEVNVQSFDSKNDWVKITLIKIYTILKLHKTRLRILSNPTQSFSSNA